MAPYLTKATICAPGFKIRRQLLKMLHGTPIKIQTEDEKLELTGVVHDDAWFEPGQIKINIRAIELVGEQEIKIEGKDLVCYISTKELSVVGA